ncbi:MAG: MerR family transcriptional regulator [Bacteroidales bacterium]|nr:MerR family transcriptional regulator [Bacteroidales bacterium]MDD5976475.1 MerR family transcriptional regulator [Bacteroidales bacterium]MDD6613281.1 MerR family transcriptional regulator [Bacteroidales bacterium]
MTMSKNKIKLTIGEFSKINNISAKALRHYEKIGLLIPFERDNLSGYRYYVVEQIEQMSRIIYMKKLGFALEEIKEVFEKGQQLPEGEMIDRRLASLSREKQLLCWQERELKSLRACKKTQIQKMSKIELKSLPEIKVACFRKTIKSYDELFELIPGEVFSQMQKAGCECAEPDYCFTIDHNKGFNEDGELDIEYFQAVKELKADTDAIKFRLIGKVETAVCISHKGSYDLLNKTWSEVFSYLENNGYALADNPRFVYIDGVWNCKKEEDWLTEIQCPVVKR